MAQSLNVPRKMNLPSSSASSLTSITWSHASTASPIGTPLKSAESLATKRNADPFELPPSMSDNLSLSPQTRPSVLYAQVPSDGRPASTLSPVGAKLAADNNDVKKNLLEMISKSDERRRKPRALPNLQTISSSTPPDTSPLSPRTGEMTAMGRLSPRVPFSPSPITAPMAGILRPEVYTNKEVPSIGSWVSSYPTTMKIAAENLRPGVVIPAAKIESEPSLPSTVISENMETEAALMSPVTSEIMYQAKDDSSSGEIDTRNLMPLSLEMEKREEPGALDSRALGLTDEASTGSEHSSIPSQTSLPTTLGNVRSYIHPLEVTNLEQVVATSLPDIDDR